LSRPNSKKYSGNKIKIKIEITYAFSNRIPVWESGRSVPDKKITDPGPCQSQAISNLIKIKNPNTK